MSKSKYFTPILIHILYPSYRKRKTIDPVNPINHFLVKSLCKPYTSNSDIGKFDKILDYAGYESIYQDRLIQKSSTIQHTSQLIDFRMIEYHSYTLL